jgi:hypothetical protein
MAVRLLTVTSCEEIEDGLRVSPGVPMEEMSEHEELRLLMSNGPVELRFPDGTTRMTRLMRFGVSVFKGEDGSFYVPGDESGPKFTYVFTLAPELRSGDVPPGTEIWVLSTGSGESGQ